MKILMSLLVAICFLSLAFVIGTGAGIIGGFVGL